jgi:hypothetical protein
MKVKTIKILCLEMPKGLRVGATYQLTAKHPSKTLADGWNSADKLVLREVKAR